MPAKPIHPYNVQMGQYRWSTELFNSKIDTTPGAGACWLWRGSNGPQGPLYGVRLIQADGTDIPRMTQARRVLYAEYTGTVLAAKEAVYHSCGNQNCMNPIHLTLIRPRPDILPKEPKPKAPPKRRGRPPGSKTKSKTTGEAN